jgi:predicted nucleotidyltransferase
MLLGRLAAACTSVLPDATVIVTGSLALGDYQPGKSDVDLLVLSDAPTDGLVEAVEQAWGQAPGEFDLRVVRYAAAAPAEAQAAPGARDLGLRRSVRGET